MLGPGPGIYIDGQVVDFPICEKDKDSETGEIA